jgi:phosphohistidine phosphatase
MKTLLVLRHAKSSWKAPDIADHDRPLNKRGERDAPRVGRLLRKRGWSPDLILSSTALRARRTAELVAEAARFDRELRSVPELYLAEAEVCLALLRGLDEDVERVLLVGHNPGLEQLVHLVSGADETMPTAALARIEFDASGWSDLRRGRLDVVWRPREER